MDGSLENDLVFSSQWYVSEAHVYTLGVWNMMEGGWLFREGFSVLFTMACFRGTCAYVHSRSVEYDGGWMALWRRI